LRLTQEELNNIKETVNYKNPLVKDLVDTIEVQQQEIEQEKQTRIKYQDIVYLICQMFDTWNERGRDRCTVDEIVGRVAFLKAQVAAMREAGMKCASFVTPLRLSDDKYDEFQESYNILKTSDAGKDYHNPADVEALKLAREAMEYLYLGLPFNTKESMDKTDKALAAIEKVLGGERDER
jgi:hypothetical protein